MVKIKIKQIIRETEEAITLFFEPLTPSWDYLPGQFITLRIPLEEGYVHRCYSLATIPWSDPYPAITIKKIAGGIASPYLHEKVEVGRVLEALPPRGNFLLPSLGRGRRHLVLIAGGSGITPLFSILKGVLVREAHSTISLIYANRSEEQIIYQSTLASWVETYPHRLKVTHILSQPTSSWRGYQGRLTPSLLLSLMEEEERAGVREEYALCGPPGLMEMAYHTLQALGIRSGNIHQEYFDLSKVHQQGPFPAYQLEILHDGSIYKGYGKGEESLLETSQQAGVDIPHACMRGICNTCRARCVAGSVVMEEDEGLSEEEIAEGYILTCVARARSKQVKIAL